MTVLETRSLNCPYCRGAVLVTVEPYGPTQTTIEVLKEDPTGDDLPEAAEAISTWVCPYCHQFNHAKLGGLFTPISTR